MPDVVVTITQNNNVSAAISSGAAAALSADVAARTSFAVDKFNGDGLTTLFTLTARRRANSLAVFKNGILCEKDVDYTEAGTGLSITFTTAPLTGDKIECRYAR